MGLTHIGGDGMKMIRNLFFNIATQNQDNGTINFGTSTPSHQFDSNRNDNKKNND